MLSQESEGNCFVMLCFSCHLQRSAETELCTVSLQHLPQHVGSKQHLYQSSSHTYDLLLFSAPQRPQHGQKSAHCDIILILFLPPGQPIAAEYLPDRRRCLAVRCLLVLRRRRLQNVLSPGVVMQPSLCCQPLDLTHLNSLSCEQVVNKITLNFLPQHIRSRGWDYK